MASSYIIDIHKKLYCDQCPSFIYGNLDTKSLKVNFGYKELFGSSNDIIEDSWNKATEAFGKAVDGLINKMPLFKGFKLDSKMKLRDKLIMFYILYKEFMSKTTYEKDDKSGEYKHTDDNSELLKTANTLMRDFEKQYIYNIPVRKCAPRLSINIEGLKINFSYGACNLFNAKKEVWDPMINIVNTFYPKIGKDPENPGLGTISNAANVPYEQQILPNLLHKLMGTRSKRGNYEELDFEYNMNAITKMTKTVVKQNNKSEKLKNKLLRAAESEAGGGFLKEKAAKVASLAGIGDGDSTQNAADVKEHNKDWGRFITKNNPVTADDVTSKSFEEFKNNVDKENETTANSSPLSVPEGSDTVYSSAVSQESLDTMGNLIDDIEKEGLILDNVTGSKLRNMEMKFKKGQKDGESDSLPNVLKNMINLEPKVMGQVTAEYYHSMIKNPQASHVVNFYMGFPNEYVHTIEEDTFKKKYMKEGDSKYSISYQQVIVTDMSVTFDESNLDSEGYPMSGTVDIKGLWNLLWPLYTVGYKGQENNLVSDMTVNTDQLIARQEVTAASEESAT